MGNSQQLKNDEVYSDEQIRQRLADRLPHWHLENGHIRRKYATHGWKGTLMVINAIGHLAEAAFHHPDIEASYGFVLVKLMTHSAKGVTNKDFALAEKIEQLIQWRPDPQDGGLAGTPDDPRHVYIKYD